MPNIKSAKKRLRTSQQAHAQNVTVRTRVKNARRTLLESLDGGDAKASTEAYRAYCSVLDKAAKSGVIKKNTAVRRKHRAAEKIRAAV
jgi:small subunit ribosomal protein S20